MTKRLFTLSAPIARSAAALTLAAAAFGADPALASTWTEVGDAGEGLGSLQITSSLGGPSEALTTLSASLGSGTDADLFLINIFNPATFSATTVGTPDFGDAQMFLLSLSGQAIYLNDDADDSTFFSTLPGGSPLGPIGSGLYILGISNAGYDPVNANNVLLFKGGAFTDVRGPAGNLQPATLGGFADNTFQFGSQGAYTVTLTGAGTAIPEPTSLLLLATAGAACALTSRRRQPATAPASIVGA